MVASTRWPHMADHDGLVDTHQAAILLGTTPVNVRTLVKRGRLKRIGIRRKRAVFLRSDVEALRR